MPYAVAHVLFVIFIVNLYRDYIAKKKFSRFYVILAGIFGLLPDIDLMLDAFTSTVNHGDFHLLLFPFVFFLLFLLFKHTSIIKKDRVRYNTYILFLMLTIGYFVHIILDSLGGGYAFLAPFYYRTVGIKLIPFEFFPILDTVLLLLWLVYEYHKHNTLNYI